MSFNFLKGVKKVTHVLATGAVVVAGFALTPAGQAIIAQYPKVTVVFALATTLSTIYHRPVAE